MIKEMNNIHSNKIVKNIMKKYINGINLPDKSVMSFFINLNIFGNMISVRKLGIENNINSIFSDGYLNHLSISNK